MKRLILATLCSLGLLGTLSAQDTFRKGEQTVSLGVGVGSVSGSYTLPPLSALYEYSVVDGLFDGYGSVGIGGQLEFEQHKVLNTTYSNFFLGVRATLHYEPIDRLDIYGGLAAGLRRKGLTDRSSFLPVGLVGARYYISNAFGLYGELSTGVSIAKVGFTLKF